jgi:hypothetical protein
MMFLNCECPAMLVSALIVPARRAHVLENGKPVLRQDTRKSKRRSGRTLELIVAL